VLYKRLCSSSCPAVVWLRFVLVPCTRLRVKECYQCTNQYRKLPPRLLRRLLGQGDAQKAWMPAKRLLLGELLRSRPRPTRRRLCLWALSLGEWQGVQLAHTLWLLSPLLAGAQVQPGVTRNESFLASSV